MVFPHFVFTPFLQGVESGSCGTKCTEFVKYTHKQNLYGFFWRLVYFINVKKWQRAFKRDRKPNVGNIGECSEFDNCTKLSDLVFQWFAT